MIQPSRLTRAGLSVERGCFFGTHKISLAKKERLNKEHRLPPASKLTTILEHTFKLPIVLKVVSSHVFFGTLLVLIWRASFISRKSKDYCFYGKSLFVSELKIIDIRISDMKKFLRKEGFVMI